METFLVLTRLKGDDLRTLLFFQVVSGVILKAMIMYQLTTT